MLNAKKVIFHIDMDAFFASCAESQNPKLRARPIAIAYDGRRSIITAANYQARAFGVRAAMPVHQAKQLCSSLKIIDPDYELYQQKSVEVWNLIKQKFGPLIEVLSIDECFLDVSKIWKKYGSPLKMAQTIQELIWQKTNLSASVGISYNKFLAKMATDMQKPHGITIIKPQELAIKLWPLEIEKMYGVGIATSKILKEQFQIKTIGDLSQINAQELEKQTGKFGLVLWNHAQGNGSDKVSPERNVSKSISNETTLDYGISDSQELEELLLTLTENNLFRLNKQDLLVKTVAVYLRYQWVANRGEFDKLKHLKHHSKQLSLIESTNNLETIFALVKECFHHLYQTGKIVVLIGVSFQKVKSDHHWRQLSFDDNLDLKINPEIDDLILKINQRYQNKKIFYGHQIKTLNGEDNKKFRHYEPKKRISKK